MFTDDTDLFACGRMTIEWAESTGFSLNRETSFPQGRICFVKEVIFFKDQRLIELF